ncbi:MAG: MFS transporter [Candidatus Pacebacteria bacterium]|nr:MFS transporter [Candidatus Paceibacterota bacterium]
MHTRIIRQYYILASLFRAGGHALHSAIYVTFLMQHGLNLFEVNLVNACYFTAIFFCEIPTGVFADVFGRKHSFVTACGLMALALFVYGSSQTLAGFIVAELICAVAHTFESGAFKAWFVDSLRHQGYEGNLSRIFGRERVIGQVAGGIAAITGSYLYAIHPTLPWYLSSVILIITMVAAHRIMKEDYFTRTMQLSWRNGLSTMRDTAVTSIRYGMNDRAVRFTLIVTGIMSFAVMGLNMYWQPFFVNRSIDARNLGYIFGGIMIAIGIGSYLASRRKEGTDEKQLIVVNMACTGVLVITAALVPGVALAVFVFLLHEIPRGALSPLMDSYLHTRIPSRERATISSFCSMAPHICGALGLLVSGLLANTWGIETAWIIAGTVLIVGALIVRNGRHPPT